MNLFDTLVAANSAVRRMITLSESLPSYIHYQPRLKPLAEFMNQRILPHIQAFTIADVLRESMSSMWVLAKEKVQKEEVSQPQPDEDWLLSTGDYQDVMKALDKYETFITPHYETMAKAREVFTSLYRDWSAGSGMWEKLPIELQRQFEAVFSDRKFMSHLVEVVKMFREEISFVENMRRMLKPSEDFGIHKVRKTDLTKWFGFKSSFKLFKYIATVSGVYEKTP